MALYLQIGCSINAYLWRLYNENNIEIGHLTGFADHIQPGKSGRGLTDPAVTLSFDEVVLATNASVTTEYSSMVYSSPIPQPLLRPLHWFCCYSV